jgi:hypothetical protein
MRRTSAEGAGFEFRDVRTEPFPLSVREIGVLGEVDLPCGSHERNSFRSDWYAVSFPLHKTTVLNGALERVMHFERGVS